DSLVVYAGYGLVLLVPLALYACRQVRKEKRVRAAVANGELFSDVPRGQHPSIDVSHCIGCQGCTRACPEGDVLGMVGGRAAVVKPHKCIGHGLCAEACPVGAITMANALPGVRSDLPYLTPDLETSVANLFIAGELGGLALIRNAVNQGRNAIDAIAARLAAEPSGPPIPGMYDVVIVGAGPAGISASLRAIERELNYVTLERDVLGGSVSKYPRQKLVMTSPVAFPLGASLKKMQLSKENLLAFWKTICDRRDFHVRLNEPVNAIRKHDDGLFTIATPNVEYRARAVLLAMGRSGTPRKLGVKGEDLPHVMYRLIEAEHYTNKNILVVGGGDSAVEAAMGLAMQKGNHVTLSYRKSEFARIKERNAQRLRTVLRSGKLNVIFNSMPAEFAEGRVLLDVDGQIQEIPNDFVWIFAGGVAPNDFLKKTGIAFGSRDLTLETVREGESLGVSAVSKNTYSTRSSTTP
ncbi:MAG TPA: NAD(P)-binding domain-containing protein, partial [Candidatus Sulfopaludibacter sp.]|nr:NAD(P)-binding domain-containing protein [Candidatus Sulfopaludibacter sp.]